MHEMGRTQQAKDVLLEGPPSLNREPTFHYNMACYERSLGNLAAARAFHEPFRRQKRGSGACRPIPTSNALYV